MQSKSWRDIIKGLVDTPTEFVFLYFYMWVLQQPPQLLKNWFYLLQYSATTWKGNEILRSLISDKWKVHTLQPKKYFFFHIHLYAAAHSSSCEDTDTKGRVYWEN